MLGLGIGLGVRNRVRVRVRVRDRFRDGVRDRMLGFGELGRNRYNDGYIIYYYKQAENFPKMSIRRRQHRSRTLYRVSKPWPAEYSDSRP